MARPSSPPWAALWDLQKIDSTPRKRVSAEIEKKRNRALQRLPANLAHLYERLRRGRTPPWVLELSGDACPGCNFVLPLKLRLEVLSATQPIPCPSCSRLLLRE